MINWRRRKTRNRKLKRRIHGWHPRHVIRRLNNIRFLKSYTAGRGVIEGAASISINRRWMCPSKGRVRCLVHAAASYRIPPASSEVMELISHDLIGFFFTFFSLLYCDLSLCLYGVVRKEWEDLASSSWLLIERADRDHMDEDGKGKLTFWQFVGKKRKRFQRRQNVKVNKSTWISVRQLAGRVHTGISAL